MFKVGLTGGIASGKSTICKLFKQHGITIIDADIIARELVEVGQEALIEIANTFAYEKDILLSDGSLNRPVLRSLIFSDSKAKQTVEAILHPRIRQQLQRQSEQAQSTYCIIAIPLLIEANFQHSVDRILLIDIDAEQQIERLCLRDKISTAEAMKIINSQSTRQQRLDATDDTINNNQTTAPLKKLVHELDRKYRILARQKTT